MQQLVFLSPLIADLSFDKPHIMDRIQLLMEKVSYPFHSSSKFLEICCWYNMRSQLVMHKPNFSYNAIVPRRRSLYVTPLLEYHEKKVQRMYWKLLNVRFIGTVFQLKMDFLRIGL